MSKGSRLLSYINARMRVTIQDSRVLVGTFSASPRGALPRPPARPPSPVLAHPLSAASLFPHCQWPSTST